MPWTSTSTPHHTLPILWTTQRPPLQEWFTAIFDLTQTYPPSNQPWMTSTSNCMLVDIQKGPLWPLFTRYIDQVAQRLFVESTKGNTVNCLFLHVPYHPCNPPSQALQKCFANAMLQPFGEALLAELPNNDNVCFNHSRMIIADHQSQNLGNLLSLCCLQVPNQLIKIWLEKNISTTNYVACETYRLVQNLNKNLHDLLITSNTPPTPTDEEKCKVS